MSDYDIGFDVGDIDMGAFDDDMGAAPRRRGRRIGRSILRVKSTPANIQKVPGVSPVALKEMVLPIGGGAFVAAGATTIAVTQQSQVPFKGRRLLIDFTRTGATATGLLTLTGFNIGIKDQRAGLGPVSAEVFHPRAVGVAMVMDPAGPGINVTAELTISAAPAAADRVDFNVSIIGDGIS